MSRGLKTVAAGIGALILISALVPSLQGVVGAGAMALLLVGILLLAINRGRGRPAQRKGVFRNFARLDVRESFKLLPESSLVALGAWSALGFSADVGGWPALVVGVVLGLAWGFTTHLGALVVDVIDIILGSVGILVSISGYRHGTDCFGPLPTGDFLVVVGVLVVAFGAAAVFGVVKRATMHRADIASFVLAMLGIIELVDFALAPGGQLLVEDLSHHTVTTSLLVGGIVLVAVVGVINARLAAFAVGYGVALGTVYLLLVQLRLFNLSGTEACTDPLPQLLLFVAFVFCALRVGTTR